MSLRIFVAVVSCWLLMGCSGGPKTVDTGPAPSGQAGVEARLKDPSVSEQEKDQIRKSMAGGSGGGSAQNFTTDGVKTAPQTDKP